MHNKSFTADGEVAIVGGRNIGDEYFGANEAMNFADLDVAVIGRWCARCPTNSTSIGIISLRFR
jgi:putative cardiolipin synthase